jgi:phosphatidylinositol phospholipase C beta
MKGKQLFPFNFHGIQFHLIVFICRESKDMRTKQAKISVETAKEVTNDKTLRNKAEKDRRLREKHQNNTKKFIEERKMTAIKQEKEKEKLAKLHEKQMEELVKDIHNVSIKATEIFYAWC